MRAPSSAPATIGSMFTLYYRPTCPFSKKVLAAAKELGVGLELRDIGETVHRDELVRQGGKQQVPYLVDRTRSVGVYESEDIISYLKAEPPRNHDVPKGISASECQA